jgi:hypothetical protein
MEQHLKLATGKENTEANVYLVTALCNKFAINIVNFIQYVTLCSYFLRFKKQRL